VIIPRKPLTTDDVALHYDAFDAFYRATWGLHLHHGYWEQGEESVSQAISRLTETVALLARLAPGDQVCDVGCGYGATSSFFARKYRTTVTGLTLSRIQYEHALSLEKNPPSAHGNLAFLHQDWLQNELPPASFDAVISMECISHITDKAKFFSEIYRTLKPGGRTVICAWLAPPSPSKWQLKYLLEPICRDGCIAGMASLSQYESLIREAGLRPVEQRRIGKNVRKTWRIIFRRALAKILRNSSYRRFFISTLRRTPGALLVVPRLIWAYQTGILDYIVIVAEKPPERFA
jgi:tocopherol O-methyltransferase